ncbi:MAG: hypothetical protein AB1521_01580 [Bacteroidota bacterium]
MKKLFLLVTLLSSLTYSQVDQTKSILELKQQSTIISSGFQYPVSSIKHQASSIEYQEFSLPQTEGRKSPALAILYSMLLPGMGELYAGSYDKGYYFTVADGVLWGVFAGFNIYGNWQEDNYKSFAQSNGGVNNENKDEEYYAIIGVYSSIDDYNTTQELNRDFNKVYNTSTHYWKWNSDAERKEYRNMWSSSEGAFNNVRFAVGALILNRIISAVNAVRLVSAHNKSLTEQIGWNVSFGVENKATLPSSFTVNFIKTF